MTVAYERGEGGSVADRSPVAHDGAFAPATARSAASFVLVALARHMARASRHAGQRTSMRWPSRRAAAIVSCRRQCWPGRKLREHDRLPQPSPATKVRRCSAFARRRAACRSTSAAQRAHCSTSAWDCRSAQ